MGVILRSHRLAPCEMLAEIKGGVQTGQESSRCSKVLDVGEHEEGRSDGGLHVV